MTPLATLLFPLYIYPEGRGAAWRPLLDVAAHNPHAKVLMVVNPSNGPGTDPVPDYVAGIGELQSAGIPMAGYVYTEYGARPIEAVEEELSRWRRLYPHVRQAFVDNMATAPGSEAYYTRLTAFARSVGLTSVMGNAGAAIPRSYLETVDTVVIYEDLGYPASAEDLDPYGWYRLYRQRLGMIAHGVSSLDEGFIRKAVEIAEYICVTETYQSVPPYLDRLLSLLGGL